ncbi:MAG: hypothetical protein P9M06_02020 [Candidatus Saelkia tenebricola]|nr:hypothetical protein [Candidatus Saelkia tenebricola]
MIKVIFVFSCFVFSIFINFNTGKESYALRRMRQETINWQVVLEDQLNIIRSNYPYEASKLEKDIQESQRYLPKVAAWVSDILENYETKFGGGKLVFFGGACKKVYQVAKLLSVQYGVPNEKIIYLDLPRRIVGGILSQHQDEGLERFLAQEGLLNSDEPIALIDVCIDTWQQYDPVLHVARVIKETRSQIPLYCELITVRGMGLTEQQLEYFVNESEGDSNMEALFEYLEYSPRYRQPNTVVETDGVLEITYNVEESASSHRFLAQNILTYYAAAESLSLMDDNNLSGVWSQYVLDLMANIGRTVTLEELRLSLGLNYVEDYEFFNQELFFMQAITHTLNELLSSGEISKTADRYYLP